MDRAWAAFWFAVFVIVTLLGTFIIMLMEPRGMPQEEVVRIQEHDPDFITYYLNGKEIMEFSPKGEKYTLCVLAKAPGNSVSLSCFVKR